MKKVLYVLTDNLSLFVIKSQVLSHVNLLEKKIKHRKQILWLLDAGIGSF